MPDTLFRTFLNQIYSLNTWQCFGRSLSLEALIIFHMWIKVSITTVNYLTRSVWWICQYELNRLQSQIVKFYFALAQPTVFQPLLCSCSPSHSGLCQDYEVETVRCLLCREQKSNRAEWAEMFELELFKLKRSEHVNGTLWLPSCFPQWVSHTFLDRDSDKTKILPKAHSYG